MLSTSTKRWVIGLVALLIILLAILLAWFFRTHSSPKVAATVSTKTAPAVSATSSGTTTNIPAPVSSSAITLSAEAKLFIERYGSFSSQANDANLKDVLPLMTDALAGKTEAIINQTKTPSATFYGVSVRTVTVNVNAVDDTAGTAMVTVGAQLQETKGNAAPIVRYQTAVLTFKKIGADWKVDSVTWK